jgi:hypothetical protein
MSKVRNYGVSFTSKDQEIAGIVEKIKSSPMVFSRIIVELLKYFKSIDYCFDAIGKAGAVEIDTKAITIIQAIKSESYDDIPDYLAIMVDDYLEESTTTAEG